MSREWHEDPEFCTYLLVQYLTTERLGKRAHLLNKSPLEILQHLKDYPLGAEMLGVYSEYESFLRIREFGKMHRRVGFDSSKSYEDAERRAREYAQKRGAKLFAVVSHLPHSEGHPWHVTAEWYEKPEEDNV